MGENIMANVAEAYLPVKVLHLNEIPARRSRWWK